MRTDESKRTHEEKVDRLKQGHEERKKLLGRPGPRFNTYMKMRREQFQEQSHARKS